MFVLWKVREFRLDTLFTILLVAISIFLFGEQMSIWLPEKADVITSVSVTLLGFLITSMVILLTFPENHRIKFIKKHPTYLKIYYYFLFTITLFLALAVTSFILSLLPILFPLTTLFLVWSTISLIRCIWILKKMIDLYFQQKDGEG